MPGRKVNPRRVALELSRGATQVEAYKAGGGESDDDSLASRYCSDPEVVRLLAFYNLSTEERLALGLRASDDTALAVLTGEVDATRLDEGNARSYFAQRERTHTAIKVDITHRVDFHGLRGPTTIPLEVENASVSSLQRLEEKSQLPEGDRLPALPTSASDCQSVGRRDPKADGGTTCDDAKLLD